jgi:acyl-homoserine-lactone acylase
MRYLSILIIFSVSFFACGATQPAPSAEEAALSTQTDAGDLSQQVIIRRTEFGVPHIYADNIEAAGFALGYLQMEDYGERVAELLLRARGEWAKHNNLTGSERTSAINSDASNRRDYRRAVETWQKLEPDTRQILTGFAKGVNRYIELHPDEFDDWVKPHYTGYDVHARGVTGPSSGTIRTFLSALARQREADNEEMADASQSGIDLFDNQTVWAQLAAEYEEPHHDAGSNVWAFAPERTTSGNAILMRNPHLSWDAGYYEAKMVVPGKFTFYGDFRIGGALGIIGGFNERLGWSTTNNNPDTDEIYSFDADPDKPDHFLLDGTSVPITKETVEVEFRHGNALGLETREFLTTPYGPVIHREDGKVYIIRAAADGEFRAGEQFFKMMKAQNFEEWQDAMKMRARASSNLTYADADGNIYYVWNATMPDRPHEAGGDTTAIHVTSSDEMWHDILPWEDLPQLKNPKGGYVKNENDPFHFTNMHEILHPDDFPSYFPEPAFRLRSQHSHELVHNDKKFSLEDVVEMKNSERMLMADRVKEDLIKAVEATDPEGEIADAIQLMREWDNTVARDSRGGLLFKTWWNRYRATADEDRVESSPASVGYSATPEKLFAKPWTFDEPDTTPYGLADFDRAVESFEWAVEEATDRYGHWNLPWGEVHRAVIGDLDVAVGGCTGLLGCYRVIWFTSHRDDEQKYEVRGGDGWVFAVEFGEVPRAYTVLAYGQSIKEDSPHFNDQLLIFTNNEMTPIAFTEEEVMQQLIREYRPGE